MRIVLFAAVLLSSAATYAAGITSFRCPDTDHLVRVGMSMDAVVSACRSPDDTNEHQETVLQASMAYVGREPVLTQIERQVTRSEWTFDFGHDRFVRYLSFLDGDLTHIREGGYGAR